MSASMEVVEFDGNAVTAKQLENQRDQVLATAINYAHGTAPLLYAAEPSSVQFISGSEEAYRVIDTAQSSVLHLAPEPNGFVPIVESQSQHLSNNLTDKGDGYRTGRRDSSLMCVDLLESYQTHHPGETDVSQYFQDDIPSVHFYPRDYLHPSHQQQQPDAQYPNPGHASLPQETPTCPEAVAHHQQAVDLNRQQHNNWQQQTETLNNRGSDEHPEPVPDEQYPAQYLRPESAREAAENCDDPMIDPPKLYPADTRIICPQQQQHAESDSRNEETLTGPTPNTDNEPKSEENLQVVDDDRRHEKCETALAQLNNDNTSHFDARESSTCNVNNVDVNNNIINSSGMHETPYAIQQHYHHTECHQPERYANVFIDGQIDHNSLYYHTRRYHNESTKYDAGGSVIEYRPTPTIAGYHQYHNTAFVEPILAGAPVASSLYARHSSYYSQHPSENHANHQHYQQYQYPQMPTSDGSFIETEELGKTYHVLGQNTASSYQQIVHSGTRYDHTYLETTVEPIHESSATNTYRSSGGGGGQVGQTTNSATTSLPGVSTFYDPNKEINSALLNPLEPETRSNAEKISNGSSGTRTVRNTRNGPAMQSSRCAPETIERLRLFLERRKRAREMSSDDEDDEEEEEEDGDEDDEGEEVDSLSSESIGQSHELDYEDRSRASSSCGASGKSSSSGSYSSGRKYAKLAHKTSNKADESILVTANRAKSTLTDSTNSCLLKRSTCSHSELSTSCAYDSANESDSNLRYSEANQNVDINNNNNQSQTKDGADQMMEKRQLRSRTIVLSKRS